MTTTPNLGIQLLDGEALNDWRDINAALEDVDGAAATPAAVDGAVATAISTHEAAADPHPAYLTTGEADTLFLTPAEGDAAYATVDHTHPSQQSAPWRFQNVATIADPGDGNFRSSTGVLATATTLALSRTTQDGYETPSTGYGVVGGDTIYVQDRDDNTRWVRFLVLEPLVRFATYVTSAVEVIGSAGTITDSQLCQLTFTLAGGGGGGGGGALATDTLWDARGDLVGGTGSNTAARLAVGTDGQVLTADSAQTLGVRWATPAGGGISQADADTRYVNTAGGDAMAGPLTIASKAVAVSATAGNDLTWNADGFYLDAPTKVHGHSGPASGGTLDYLPLTGGATTGPITAGGAGVASGGALTVTGSASAPTSRRLYGPGGATFGPTAAELGEGYEYGLRFTSGIAQELVSVRWYRASTATAAPALVRLWDTTTSLTVWSEANPTEWTSSTLGWLEHAVPGGTRPTLVAGRDYILSYGVTNFVNNHTGQNGYVPVPESDLTFVGHRYGSSSGSYPSNTHTHAFGIDGAFQALTAGPDPAESGAVRLPNGNEGRLAWRNAGDTADLTLTMDGSDRLALAVGATTLTTTVGAAGGASALPATPSGFWTVVLNGTAWKVPYYAT